MSALSDSHAGICPADFAARPTHIAKLLGVIFPAVAAGFGLGAAPAYADSVDLGECLASADCTRVPADFAQHILLKGTETIDGQGSDADFSDVTERESIAIVYDPKDKSDPSNILTIKNVGSVVLGSDGIATVTEGGFENISFLDSEPFLAGEGGSITISNTAFYNITGGYAAFINFKDTDSDTQLDVRTLIIENSSVYKYTVDEHIAPFITFKGGAAVIRNSVFDSVKGSEAAGPIQIYEAQILQVDNSRFNNNEGNFGSAIEIEDHAKEGQDPYLTSDLTVRGSYFTNNTALTYGGAINLEPTVAALYYISGSEFTGNRADDTNDGGEGGAISLRGKADASLTIRDSVFKNNTAGEEGGAIFIAPYESSYSYIHVTLNIVSDESDVIFDGNKSDWKTGGDIDASNTTLNLYSREGTKISFGSDIEMHAGADHDEDGVININQSGQTYSYSEWDEAKSVKNVQTAEAAAGGEVEFKSFVRDADIRLYSGTLTLRAPDAANLDGDLLVIDNFRTSSLTVAGDSALKTRDAEPVSAADYTVSTISAAHDAAADLAAGIALQKIQLASGLTLNANLSVIPAVDLSAATEDNGAMAASDKFGLAGDAGTVTGSGRLTVKGWIIKADNESLKTVYVDLADGDALKSAFALDSGTAAVAVGPIYVWQVAQKEADSSVFVFTRPENESGFFAADPVVPEEPAPVVTPFDFNPDIYGGQVASLSTGIIQHAISEAVFSEQGLAAGFIADAGKPERKPWWVRVRGGDLKVKPKNFYRTDLDYAVGMIGHQFDPLHLGAGKMEFGAYLGAATSSAKYSDNKVRQSGGFLGGSVLYRAGGAFIGAHVNAGIMDNRLRGVSDTSFSTPWFGAGAAAGISFEFPAARLAVTPMVDVSYAAVKSKDYTTGQGAQVKNSNLHSLEAAPGIRIDKHFNRGWSAFAQGRYAFVSKSGGTTATVHATDSAGLPAIRNKNYAEYGFGIEKQTRRRSYTLNVNRNDGGRSGWTGMVRVAWHF
jgi:hypothetical protein